MKPDRQVPSEYPEHSSFGTALEYLTGINESGGLIDVFVDSIPAIIGILDDTHTVLRYNRAGYDYFGISPEEAHGKKCFEIIGRDSICEECATAEALRTGKPANLEKYVSDMSLWFDMRAYPIRSTVTGEITGVIEHLWDITESKKADMSLTWSELKHRHLLQTMQEGLVEQTGKELTFVNESFCRMTGYTRSELLSTDIRLLFDDDNWDHFMAQQKLREQGRSDPYEVELLRKDGSILTVYISPYAEIHEGRLVRSTGVITDISRLKQAELEKLQLTVQVQHAQKLESLGVLAGSIAHDFNNLLMSMLGNADLALSELPETSPVAGSIREIVNAARQASDLTRQMLAYAGRGNLQKEPVDVNEVVESMVRLMEVSFARHGSIELQLQRDLPHVMADPTQLRQIVMNLVTNASEAISSDGSTVRVSTSCREYSTSELENSLPSGSSRGGEYVSFEVCDDGCGIDIEVMDKLFDPFFTTKRTGRGLGLAVLLGIVGSHEGCVIVDSDPGKGSCFRVLLPVCAEFSGLREIDTEKPVTMPLTISGSVLIVDDEAAIREVSSRMLENLGLNAVTASDLDSSREILSKPGGNTILLLIDHSMPGMSGNQLIKELGKLVDDIPVVVSSGFSSEDVLPDYDGIDVRAFLHKPYSTADLARLMTEVFKV